MTVRELISELQRCDPDLTVVVPGSGSREEGWVTPQIVRTETLHHESDDWNYYGTARHHHKPERCIPVVTIDAEYG